MNNVGRWKNAKRSSKRLLPSVQHTSTRTQRGQHNIFNLELYLRFSFLFICRISRNLLLLLLLLSSCLFWVGHHPGRFINGGCCCCCCCYRRRRQDGIGKLGIHGSITGFAFSNSFPSFDIGTTIVRVDQDVAQFTNERITGIGT